jgi:hypothetical protein
VKIGSSGLFVGIGEFANLEHSWSTTSTSKSAADLQSYFLRASPLHDYRLMVRLEELSRGTILNGFSDWVKSVACHSLGIFYLGSHGATISGKNMIFTPQVMTPKDSENAIPLDRLIEIIQENRASETEWFLCIDCCRLGGKPKPLSVPEGIVLLFACGTDAPAYQAKSTMLGDCYLRSLSTTPRRVQVLRYVRLREFLQELELSVLLSAGGALYNIVIVGGVSEDCFLPVNGPREVQEWDVMVGTLTFLSGPLSPGEASALWDELERDSASGDKFHFGVFDSPEPVPMPVQSFSIKGLRFISADLRIGYGGSRGLISGGLHEFLDRFYRKFWRLRLRLLTFIPVATLISFASRLELETNFTDTEVILHWRTGEVLGQVSFRVEDDVQLAFFSVYSAGQPRPLDFAALRIGQILESLMRWDYNAQRNS